MRYLSNYPHYRAAEKRARAQPFAFPALGNIHVLNRYISRDLAFYAAAIGQKHGLLPPGNLSAWSAASAESDRRSGEGHVMFARGKEQVRVDVRFLNWQPSMTVELLPERQPETAPAPLHDGIRHPASQGRSNKGVAVMFSRRKQISSATVTPIASVKPTAANKADDAKQSAPRGFFAEIRTRAGKTKYRTPTPSDSAAEAAALAFRDGPEWARECVTYAIVQTHRRAA